MKQNLNAKIRAYLETLDTPVRAVDVAIALDAPRNIVNNAMSSMAKVGLVTYARGVGYTKGDRKPLTAKEAYCWRRTPVHQHQVIQAWPV